MKKETPPRKNNFPEQTCSVELDEWRKRMKTGKTSTEDFQRESRRDPRRYRSVQEDS